MLCKISQSVVNLKVIFYVGTRYRRAVTYVLRYDEQSAGILSVRYEYQQGKVAIDYLGKHIK
jgi:hypothetical protein